MIISKQILVLIGPPGSGKSFYSQWLQKKHHFFVIASGDLCRSNLQRTVSSLGKTSKQIMQQGKLIDADLITQLVDEALHKSSFPLVLDGFPRNIKQYQNWIKLIKQNDWSISFLIFQCSLNICWERIKNRLVCSQCGSVYNTVFKPPQKPNYCDLDQHLLVPRFDDGATEKRMIVFQEETQPMIKEILSQNKFSRHIIDVSFPSVKVQKQLMDILHLI